MLAVQMIFCAVLVLGGGMLLLIGARALGGTLPRNQRAGVRTPATLRSEDTFQQGNRAAAPAIVAAGAIGLLTGVSLPMLSSASSVGIVATLGFVGGFALLAVGGLIGNRVAAAMPEPTPADAGCAGCPGGCCGS